MRHLGLETWAHNPCMYCKGSQSFREGINKPWSLGPKWPTTVKLGDQSKRKWKPKLILTIYYSKHSLNSLCPSPCSMGDDVVPAQVDAVHISQCHSQRTVNLGFSYKKSYKKAARKSAQSLSQRQILSFFSRILLNVSRKKQKSFTMFIT